jgi:hypothetical protein
MKVKRKTPRTEMVYHAIIRKLASFYRTMAIDEGVPSDILDIQLTQYAVLCARVEFEEGEVDFNLSSPRDDEGAIQAEIEKYMDTQHIEKIVEALAAIRKEDRPVDDVTAPDAPDDKKK